MKIKRDKDYYIENENIFNTSSIDLSPGITVLVGCNGYGKTTTLSIIKSYAKENSIPFIEFNNFGENDNHNTISRWMFYEDYGNVATSLSSSEGQKIVIRLNEFAINLGNFIRKNKDEEYIFVLIDAIDSGLSIDNIEEVKNLLNIVKNDCGDNLYIVVSANNYSLVEGEKCIDVKNNKEIMFSDYLEYKKFIISCKENMSKY